MRVKVGLANEWQVGQLRSVEANGVSIVVGRMETGFCAVVNRCPHMGFPLGGGKLLGDVIVCPWHNSKFNMCTGENLAWVTGVAGVSIPDWSRPIVALGRKAAPVKTYRATEEDGAVFVEME